MITPRLTESFKWTAESRSYHESVQLPVNPPILPMLSKRIAELPTAGEWIFEPKWDGFRTLIFRDGEEILLQSRDEKSLNRYFRNCWIR
jgi:ATP-dependent DNA ligase